jgi:hypothetical protein
MIISLNTQHYASTIYVVLLTQSIVTMSEAKIAKFAATGYGGTWVQKLVTKEDPRHVHKTLGILVLLSFIWRLSQCGATDMGFETRPEWTVPTLVLHLLLNLSAFTFRIPPRRIDSGYRIWPEYRVHSLVFLCRSLANIFVSWLEMTFSLEPNYAANYLIVIATIAAADLGSMSFGKNQSGFARKLDVPNYVRYFFSIMQLYATSGCLFGMRRSAVQFLIVIIIQCNAFLMTIQRKNLAGHNTLVSIYSSALLLGIFVGRFELNIYGTSARLITSTIGSLAIMIRLGPLPPAFRIIQNKYVMWTVLAYFMHRLRPLVDGNEENSIMTPFQLNISHKVCFAGMVTLGWYNSAYVYEKREKADTATKKVE